MHERVRRNVVWLGMVSLFADVAGEMVAPILPLYITVTLGAPATAVGFVDGAAELAASLFRALGGWWSDRAGKRKPTVIFGYTLSALSKPALAMTGAWGAVLGARVADRAGKGLRGTARDALIAASVEKESLGSAFGLHRAMDTAGAVMGPLCGLWLMERWGFTHRQIFFAAGVPAFLAVGVILLFVREAHEVLPPGGPEPAREAAAPVRALAAGERPRLSPAFWKFLLVYGIFALGNSSDSFILLKARASGLAETSVILAYVLFNLVNASLAPSIGRRADAVGRRRTVATGFAVYAVCYAGFAVASPAALWPLFALYGFHAALVEGSFRAVVSQFSEEGNRGTAHGVFQSVAGVLAFTASAVAGLLWTRVAPSATFWFGAACAAVASAALFSVAPPRDARAA